MVRAPKSSSPTYQTISVSLALAFTAVACGRLNFNPLNLDADVASDSGVLGPDAAIEVDADVAAVLEIRCTAPTPVAPTVPTTKLVEAGLRANGLALYSRFGSTDFVASRTNGDSPFEDWTTSETIQSIPEDPTFVELNGAEVGAGARGGGSPPRSLILCEPPFDTNPCSTLSMFDSDGVAIVDDIDGPSLAVRGGKLTMAFNRDSAIYIALPRGPGNTDWDARQVNLGTQLGDDPTLTNNGDILVVGVADGVLSLQWDPAQEKYVSPRLIEGLPGNSPEIGLESINGFEVFVSLDTRGISEPHRAECTY